MNLDMHMEIGTAGFLILLLGTIGGAVVVWRLKRFIRTGHYRRNPVEKDGEEWYETPVWLRLPFWAACGFTLTSLILLLASFVPIFWGTIILLFGNFNVITVLELILGLVLFLLERSSKHGAWLKRVTICVSFFLGAVLTYFLFVLVNLIQS